MCTNEIVLENAHLEALQREVTSRISQLSPNDQREAMSTLNTALEGLNMWDQLVYLDTWIQGFDYALKVVRS
jgi:hypothetical protein